MNNFQLLESVNDAYVMLQFASSQGVEIDQGVCDAILLARRSSGDLTEVQEYAFWRGYAKLAKCLVPATLDSIVAQRDSSVRTSLFGMSLAIPIFSPAKQSILSYTILTFGMLILFLYIQTYIFDGMSALKDIDACNTEMNTLLRQEMGEDGSETVEIPPVEKEKKTKMAQELKVRKENLSNKRNALYVYLAAWNDKAAYFNQFFYKIKETEIKQSAVAAKKNEVYRDNLQQIMAEYTVKVVSLYVVPMICGVLGVCSYVLRELSSEIKARTFTKASRIRFRLRIPLGFLVGAVTGFLFFNNEPYRFTTVLPPIGIAFVFGYSVEMFFSILDNMLATFTNKQ